MFLFLIVISKLVFIKIALAADLPSREWMPLMVVWSVSELLLYALILRYYILSAGAKSIRVFSGFTMNLLYVLCVVSDGAAFAAFLKPLDLGLWREGNAAMPLATMLSLVTLPQWIFIALPFVGVVLAWYYDEVLKKRLFNFACKILSPVVAGIAFFLLIGAVLLYTGSRTALVTAPVRLPAFILMSALGQNTALLAANTEPKTLTGAVQPGKPEILHAGKRKARANVLFIVMESTGSRYVFDEKLTLAGQGIPMPFLKKISRQSLYLSRHYATANSSPRALFSIFTGLYPEPSDEFFSLKRTLKIRTWNTYAEALTSLLVTPCATEWYFPSGLFKNNGVSEIIGKGQLRFEKQLTQPSDAQNEIQSGDYFASRLRSLREPFFATYISFAPHYPYHDYGSEWRIAPAHTRLDRYVNNLRLLDAQIEKFFIALETRGILRNTIIVLVGDHSEAFKQHSGNYIHSLHSYEENLAVPALIYYPVGLKPQTITYTTSHVDLAPTLLDLLEIEHSPQNFQGESLLRSTDRQYIYAYGNEGTVTAYNRDGIKLQRLKGGSCRVFDLATDADERAPLACTGKENQQTATEYFFQKQFLLLQNLQSYADR